MSQPRRIHTKRWFRHRFILLPILLPCPVKKHFIFFKLYATFVFTSIIPFNRKKGLFFVYNASNKKEFVYSLPKDSRRLLSHLSFNQSARVSQSSKSPLSSIITSGGGAAFSSSASACACAASMLAFISRCSFCCIFLAYHT